MLEPCAWKKFNSCIALIFRTYIWIYLITFWSFFEGGIGWLLLLASAAACMAVLLLLLLACCLPASCLLLACALACLLAQTKPAMLSARSGVKGFTPTRNRRVDRTTNFLRAVHDLDAHCGHRFGCGKQGARYIYIYAFVYSCVYVYLFIFRFIFVLVFLMFYTLYRSPCHYIPISLYIITRPIL